MNRRRFAPVVIGIAIIATLGVAAAYVALVVRPEQKARATEERLSQLEQRIEERGRFSPRFTRRPLHGETRPGPGGLSAEDWREVGQLFDDQYVIQAFGHHAEPLSPEALAELEGARPIIDRLRSRSSHGYVTELAERPTAETVPWLGSVLMADARRSPPGACLVRALDAIRMMQDVVVTIEPWEAGAELSLIYWIQPLVASCAFEADSQMRARAIAGLRQLDVERGPAAWVQCAVNNRDDREWVRLMRARMESPVAEPVDFDELGGTLDHLETMLDRSESMMHYCRATESSRPSFPEALTDAPELLEGAARRDAAAAMGLRQLAVAICAYDEVLDDALPESPSCLSDAALADPFTGEPFSWERDADGRGATIIGTHPPRELEWPPEEQPPYWLDRHRLRIELPPIAAHPPDPPASPRQSVTRGTEIRELF